MAGSRYHNIDTATGQGDRPRSPTRYVGYADSGTKYYITYPGVNSSYWRAAPVLYSPEQAARNEPPYFYARTLREISAKLETIKGSN